PLKFDAPVISDDPGLIEALDRRAEIATVKKEYDSLDKNIKGRFKDDKYAGKQFVAGKHFIEIASRHRKGFTVADSDYLQVKITS
ncbi:unnamed protein product, partial [marine sediment metagenome]